VSEEEIRADERRRVAERIEAATGRYIAADPAYLRGLRAAAIVADPRDWQGRQISPCRGGVPVSGPYVEQTAEPGALGVELINDQKVRTAVAQAVRRGRGNEWLAADEVLLGPVAVLVAAAEERGAAKERERIVVMAARRARETDGSWVDPKGSRLMAQALYGFAHDVDHGGTWDDGPECQNSTVDHLNGWIDSRDDR